MLKIDLGSNKFCEVICNKLQVIGIPVKDSLVRRASLTLAKEEVFVVHAAFQP